MVVKEKENVVGGGCEKVYGPGGKIFVGGGRPQ
jgi:hypothetical protein